MARAPEPARQLALDLAGEPRHGVEDFLVGPSNEAAYDLIDAWPAWPDGVLLLTGAAGAGKTHLAAIWAARARARLLPVSAVVMERVPEIAAQGAIVIEDCDGALMEEAAMFHLLNLLRARQGFALLTARQGPQGWGIATPDLLSRLRLAPLASIDPPDDALLKAVLVKLFLDRQLIVDTGVVDAVALRIPRSFDAARAVVEAIDRASLQRGRRITRSFAIAYAEELAE